MFTLGTSKHTVGGERLQVINEVFELVPSIPLNELDYALDETIVVRGIVNEPCEYFRGCALFDAPINS